MSSNHLSRRRSVAADGTQPAHDPGATPRGIPNTWIHPSSDRTHQTQPPAVHRNREMFHVKHSLPTIGALPETT